MVRLATVIRYISEKARGLAEQIHLELLPENRKNIDTQNLDKSLDDIRRLRLRAKELQTLVARAAISRYKDHGDLMKRIMSEMKLDQMTDLLDEQLQHLGELHADILRKLEEKQRIGEEKVRREKEESDRKEKEKKEKEEKDKEQKQEELDRAQAKREAEIDRRIGILTAIVGFSALHDLAESIFYILGKEDYKNQTEGVVTLISIVISILVLIIIFNPWGWWKKK